MTSHEHATPIVLAALVTAACSFGEDRPEFAIAVLETELVRDAESGSVQVPLELANRGDASGQTSFCTPRPGDPAINLSVEQFVDGRWTGGREDCFYACAPPTIGRVTLAPGQRLAHTARLGLDPGQYRLRVFYHPADSVALCFLSDPSSEFAVQEP